MSRKPTALLFGMAFALSQSLFAEPNRLPGQVFRMTLEPACDEKTWTRNEGWIVASIPTGGWCRRDGADLQVQDSSGNVLPVQIISTNPEGNTLFQFKSQEWDSRYWVSMGNGGVGSATRVPAGRVPSVEVRPFVGDQLGSWEEVLKVLEAKPQIDGNAILTDATGFGNPFRYGQPANFAAIYRGNIKIDKGGTYRFSTATDDASFLFLNRKLVFEQTGRRPLPRNVEEWHEVELQPGLLSFEFFHFNGSTAQNGAAGLAWKPPGKPKWETIPQAQFVTAPVAEVQSVQGLAGPAAMFVHAVEDGLVSLGASAYLTRFQAHGNFTDPAQLRWDFGDGSTGVGDSVQHVYLEPGEYLVTLQAGNQPPFRQRIFVDEPPVNSGPGALREALQVLEKTRWTTIEPARIEKILNFVIASQQPDRWKFQSLLAQRLLAQNEIDAPKKARYYEILLEAMAEEGRAAEAVQLKEKIFADLGRSASLRFKVTQNLARMQWKYLRNFKEASELYEQLIEENRRTKRPELRRVAIEWGDMFLETGDMNQAQEYYRLAATLGGDTFEATGQVRAIERGALLRIAEQKLRAGSLRECRTLLERLELAHPEQKVEALFRLLSAEVDYKSGRYAEAIRNYEVLLKLSKAASYRHQALGGIAQSFYRMGDLKKAAELLKGLEQSYPDYYQEAKFDDLAKRIDRRLAKGSSSVAFSGSRANFDPGASEGVELLGGLEIKDGLGISGRGVAALTYPVLSEVKLKQPLHGIEPGGQYWVEIWYREQPSGSGVSTRPQMTVLLTANEEMPPQDGPETLTLGRTFGQWRKVGFLLNAPEDENVNLFLRVRSLTGSFQWDGLRVVPVSAAQAETFSNFIQGDHAAHD